MDKLNSETQIKLVNIISNFVEIDLEKVTPETNLITDLEIDSIDFLDITSEIDDFFNIELPVEEWASGEGFEGENFAKYTTIHHLSVFVDNACQLED